MRRFFMLLLTAFAFSSSLFSQLITDDEFDNAEEKDLPDVKLKDRSRWLFDQGWFSKDGLPMYNAIIEVDSTLSTDQVYVSAYQTIVSSFYDSNTVTKLNDREAGSFIVEGLCRVYGSTPTMPGGLWCTCVQIRVDVKKGKVRIIAIPQYIKQTWFAYGLKEKTLPIFDAPYTSGYSKAVGSSRVSAKVYLRTYIWVKIIMDRLQKHVTDGASGIENDDW